MKKFLTIIAIFTALNCSAENSIRIGIFKGKKHRVPKCGSRDVYRQSRRQVAKAVGIFVLSCIAAGTYLDRTSQY